MIKIGKKYFNELYRPKKVQNKAWKVGDSSFLLSNKIEGTTILKLAMVKRKKKCWKKLKFIEKTKKFVCRKISSKKFVKKIRQKICRKNRYTKYIP